MSRDKRYVWLVWRTSNDRAKRLAGVYETQKAALLERDAIMDEVRKWPRPDGVSVLPEELRS